MITTLHVACMRIAEALGTGAVASTGNKRRRSEGQEDRTAISIVVFVIPPVVVALVFLCNTAIRARYYRRLHESNMARARVDRQPEEAASSAARPELSEALVTDGTVGSCSWFTLKPVAVTICRRVELDGGDQQRASVRADSGAGTSAPTLRLWRRPRPAATIIAHEPSDQVQTALVTTLISLPCAPTVRGSGNSSLRTEMALGIAHVPVLPDVTRT